MDPDVRPIDIHRKIVELIDGGRPLGVATVLATEGSTPQRVGAKAAIDADGHVWGTVGGGAVEAETVRIAVAACRSQRPVVFDFRMENDDTEKSASICGGRMRLLVDPTVARHRSSYAAAAEALERRRRGTLLTTIGSGAATKVQVEWLREDAVVDRPAGQVGAHEVFVDPVVPRPLLLVAGGGHVGQALAVQAAQIGFDVTVLDDRPEFANPALFPRGAEVRCGSVAQQIATAAMGEDTYVVIVTRGHRQDADVLEACIHQRPAYLGMIGSRRKVALMRRHFLESGLATEAEFNRIFAPIGLEIGAVTVPEIAVSIAAQLIAVRRSRGIVAGSSETHA
jgi:xanthine dehydrogenase accessory factor